MKVYKGYILGFRQKWTDKNKDLCKKLIAESDVCIEAPNGVSVGSVINTYVIKEGKTNKDIPSKFKCIEHEYKGKVIHLVDFSD